ncbi:MAG TPA: J domain-containing protein [Ramlibacter sp.]|nr:J domain-containing protein [Ramlibacter sp.]
MSGQALTYYDILRVNRRAGPDRVRLAYRKLAQQYHPDKMRGNAQAEQLMAQLNEAYAVLSDPKQRARYDEHIEAIDASRRRAHERFIARLEDVGPAWPWYLLFATITFATLAVSISMWPALLAARFH